MKLFTDDDGKAFIGKIGTKSIEHTSDFSKVLGRINWSVDQQIEDAFSQVESNVAGALKTLKENPRALRGFAQETINGLRNFIAIHSARDVGIHTMMDASNAGLKREVGKRAPSGTDLSKFNLPSTQRPESLKMGFEVARYIEAALLLKGCVAIHAEDGYEFILGDCPLINLSTQIGFHMRGALPSPETYLWFPLNPHLGLFFGEDISKPLGQGKLRFIRASAAMTNMFNRAEVYLTNEYILGRNRRMVKDKMRLPNVGPERITVSSADWHPFIMLQNDACFKLNPKYITEVRTKLNGTQRA